MKLQDVEFTSVKVARLEAGDVVVIESDVDIRGGVQEQIRNNLKTRFPDNDVIVLSPDLHLKVVRPA